MTQRLLLTLCCTAVLTGALSGCSGGVKETLGLDRQAPDEFQVVSRPPLSIPPEFKLRPPEPGAPPAGMGSAQDMGRSALFGRSAPQGGWTQDGSRNLSGGEQAFLTAAGTQQAEPDIRTLVNRESSILAEEERPFTDRLVFWRDSPEPGTAVDAEKEAQRLRQRQALGEPVTEGDTPTIKREQRGMFEGMFR
ncbi:MAG: DUF3035 domain-containing protein [Rhodospirillaceae bacterium]